MKRLLMLVAVAVMTAGLTGCNCCSNPRRVLAAAPPANCDTCQDPCANGGVTYGDPYGAPTIIGTPGPIGP